MARKRVALQYALVDRAWQKGQETYTVVWGPRIEFCEALRRGLARTR